MMGTAINESTGARMATKPASDKYRDNWDNIFGKKKQEEAEPEALEIEPPNQQIESEN
jgi:hypothetical protein